MHYIHSACIRSQRHVHAIRAMRTMPTQGRLTLLAHATYGHIACMHCYVDTEAFSCPSHPSYVNRLTHSRFVTFGTREGW